MNTGAIKKIQNELIEHKNKFEQLLDMLDDKVDETTFTKLLSGKINSKDLNDLLPDMTMFEAKIASQIEESADSTIIKIEEKFVIYDKRINKMRNEFDMSSLNKIIALKASVELVDTNFYTQEEKITTLDKNIIAIATDFETFQQAINKMHAVMIEL